MTAPDPYYVPQPGDLGLTQIGGATGMVIRVGQAFARDFSEYTHVFVFLDPVNQPGAEIIAAQPAGARVDPLETVINDRPLAIMPMPEWVTPEDRARAVEFARSLEGHRYGFEAYLWIGLAKFGFRPDWLRNLVASERGLICSAFGDAVWMEAGIHLFDDGADHRMVGEVTPGEMAHRGWILNVGTGPWGNHGEGPVLP